MNIKKFMKDYQDFKNTFEDMKMIVANIPIDKLSLENLNLLEKSLDKYRKESRLFLNSLRDDKFLYDMFPGGSESKGFCRKIGVSETEFYEMKKFLEEVSVFDVKKFVLERK